MLKIILNTLIVLSIVVSSCKKDTYLDNTTTEILDEESVFSDSTYTMEFLTNIYAYTGQDIVPIRYSYIIITSSINDVASLEELTTQSVSYYSAPQSTWMSDGYTSTTNPFMNYYSRYYTEIRACNVFRKHVKDAPLSTEIKKRTSAEARFLRAWYYASLIRLYGGVPLVGDEPYDIDATIEYKRDTYKDCVDYIVAECDSAANDLPSVAEQSETDYGRPTKGACLALKARVLLMAASPLFNGSPLSTDATLQPLVCYSASADNSLWQKAASAFLDVINLNQYSLYIDNTVPGNGFRQMFLQRSNSEYIYNFMVAPAGTLETYRFPKSRSGYGYSNPSQNLVECFGMKNGLPITDANSGYDATNPYVNRDPRFYHTIIYNQAPVYLKSSQTMAVVNIYNYLKSGVSTNYNTDGVASYQTKTGYYCRKMADDSVSASTSKNRVYPLIRYAEIILGYAEALNEANGPTSEVYSLVKQIRERAGIDAGADGSYGLGTSLTKDSMRSIIQNEYRVEFAYEGHWFYDSRRWRLAETAENQNIRGMLATRSSQSSGSFTYTSFKTLTAKFDSRMYFAPFPLTQIQMSKTFYQNPGW